MTRTAYSFAQPYDFDTNGNPKVYAYDMSWSDTPDSPRYDTKRNATWSKDRSSVEYTSDYPRNSKKTKWIFLASPLEGDAFMQGSIGDDAMQLYNGFDNFREYPAWDYRPANMHVANGGKGDDKIIGGFANNTLNGQLGDDLIISRGNGANYLSGGLGSDCLVGSETSNLAGSRDTFAFDEIAFSGSAQSKSSKGKKRVKASKTLGTASSFGVENSDLITNFTHADGDRIGIKPSAFQTDGIRFQSVATSAELDSAFTSGNNFIYDQSTGFLHFDQNGSGAGFGKGGFFARLEGNPVVNAADLIAI